MICQRKMNCAPFTTFCADPFKGLPPPKLKPPPNFTRQKSASRLNNLNRSTPSNVIPMSPAFCKSKRCLNEKSLHQLAAQVATRHKYKYALLDKVVDYAELNACRRHVLLDHFGDKDKGKCRRKNVATTALNARKPPRCSTFNHCGQRRGVPLANRARRVDRPRHCCQTRTRSGQGQTRPNSQRLNLF